MAQEYIHIEELIPQKPIADLPSIDDIKIPEDYRKSKGEKCQKLETANFRPQKKG